MNTVSSQGSQHPRGRLFLGVHFVDCGAYSRLYKNRQGTAYVGRCPRCMHPVRIRIGADGSGHRFFKAFCP